MVLLEDTVNVWIDSENLSKLQREMGYISLEDYDDEYKEIAIPNEIGRVLFFRIFLIDNTNL